MAYSRVNWQDDKTPLNAYNMNHMDEAIYNISSSVDKVIVGGKIVGTSIAQNSMPGNVIIQKSITSDQIADGAITDGKLSANAITTTAIINGAITSEKIGIGEVKSDNIQNGSIVTNKIGDSAVTEVKIANKAVSYEKLNSTGVVQGKTLISDGDGGVSWMSVPTASNTVQKILFNGVEYTPVEGTATMNQTQADFNENDASSPSYIRNKPSAMSLPTPTQEDYQKLLFVNALGNYVLGCPTEFRLGNWLIQSSTTNGFVIKWIGGGN